MRHGKAPITIIIAGEPKDRAPAPIPSRRCAMEKFFVKKGFMFMVAMFVACGMLAVSFLDVEAASVAATNDRNVKMTFVKKIRDKSGDYMQYRVENNHSNKELTRVANIKTRDNCLRLDNHTFTKPIGPGQEKLLNVKDMCRGGATDQGFRFEAITIPVSRGGGKTIIIR